MLGMSQLSREMHFSGCYLNPDTSSWPEPKHQHKPPTLKAPGVESKQSSISCVYFPCVTSTCVANTLPAGCWGGGDEDTFGAGSVHTPSVSGMSSCLVWEIPLPLPQQTASCARPQLPPLSAPSMQKPVRVFLYLFVSIKTLAQHNCWYVLWQMTRCCSCKQTALFFFHLHLFLWRSTAVNK